jgi:imidazolonepropionase-like amidohydrolase/ketosteroid isomerase-like protein
VLSRRAAPRAALLALLASLALPAACRRGAPAPAAPLPAAGNAAGDVAGDASVADTAAARRLFAENVDAIRKRDRARYLATYLQSEALTRNGPGGLNVGFERWTARRDSTWPDTLVARDLRVLPVAPGVVYGTYHYRVTQGGTTSEGRSERVFVKTPAGWRIAVSTAFGLPAGAAPPPVALVGATLVNPNAPPVPDAVVVTGGGRIACAGARGSCPVPVTAEVVDVRGAWVGPGLVDAHVHFSQTGWVDGRPDALDVRDLHPYDSVIAALRDGPERYGRAYLCSGVTAVFDVGGYGWTTALAARSATALDLPRVAAAGPLLSSIDHWVNTTAERQFIPMRDSATVRAAVRALRPLGAAAVKVWYLQLPDSLRPRARALLGLAGEEARRAGLPLIVHATQLARAKEALAAGATVLVHSVAPEDVDDEFLRLAKARNAIVIPTLTVLEGYRDVYLGRSPAERYPLACVDPATRALVERPLPESRRAPRVEGARGGRVDSSYAATVRNVRRMRAAGIAMAVGTDAGNPGTLHGASMQRELEALEAAGMPPRELFAAATLVGTRAMGLERELGSLEAGKAADLVVWDADPSAAAANMQRVRLVMRRGALYGRAELVPKGR